MRRQTSEDFTVRLILRNTVVCELRTAGTSSMLPLLAGFSFSPRKGRSLFWCPVTITNMKRNIHLLLPEILRSRPFTISLWHRPKCRSLLFFTTGRQTTTTLLSRFPLTLFSSCMALKTNSTLHAAWFLNTQSFLLFYFFISSKPRQECW